MSEGNGVLRISRKGKKKFAFGEEGASNEVIFEVDVVVVFQEWCDIYDSFCVEGDGEDRKINDVRAYHQTAVDFVKRVANSNILEITTAEALDFLARLREVYDDLASFFQPRSLEERGLPGTSEAGSQSTFPKTEMRFSTEEVG